MPRLPTAPPHTRFFGRLDRFACECPTCGTVLQASYDPSKSARRRRPGGTRRKLRPVVFNPVTSRLTCPACRAVFVAGLILWPVAPHPGGVHQPADQRPTRAQLLQLRQYATGFLMAEKRHGAAQEETNVAVLAECTCPITAGGWAPACPVHGWEATKAAQAAISSAEGEEA